METLRNREVRPSFEEIRSLVLEEKSSRKALLLPNWLFFSGSAPVFLGMLILLLPWMLSNEHYQVQESGGLRSESIQQSFVNSHINPVKTKNLNPKSTHNIEDQ